MLKTSVLHPEILSTLGSAGHLSKILISDGNYPHSTRTNPRAKIVWANFVPGVIDAVTALKMICDLVPVEAVEVMEPTKTGMYAMAGDPPIWASFRKVLKDHAGFDGELQPLQKPEFNQQANSPDCCLVIATAETQIWANCIITIGVVNTQDR
jgi:L-fucose mutarotase